MPRRTCLGDRQVDAYLKVRGPGAIYALSLTVGTAASDSGLLADCALDRHPGPSSQVKSSLYINKRQPHTEAYPYRMCSGSHSTSSLWNGVNETAIGPAKAKQV